MKHIVTEKNIALFEQKLIAEEKSAGTTAKYLQDIHSLSACLKGKPLTKETVIAWRDKLLSEGIAPVTVNSKLAAVNTYSKLMGLTLRVRYLRIQKRLFREEERDLSKEDYLRLIAAAEEKGDHRLSLLIELICSTGIRVSEVRYITVEAVERETVKISLKGKLRMILLPGKLCRKLRKYAKKEKIPAGEIFVTRTGKSLGRKQIWAEMKALCKKAGVTPTKVFPHNLRHLFAQVFYRKTKDIVKLADILGHSSVETTRIYLLSSGSEHSRLINSLGLVQ